MELSVTTLKKLCKLILGTIGCVDFKGLDYYWTVQAELGQNLFKGGCWDIGLGSLVDELEWLQNLLIDDD